MVTAGISVVAARERMRNAIEADFRRAPGVLQGRLQRAYGGFRAAAANWADDKRYAAWLGRASSADAEGGRPAPEDLKAAHDGLGAIVFSAWSGFRVTNDAGTLLLDV